MQSETYHVIGLMSGTSLDGLDIAYCKFEKRSDAWKWQILESETVPYPEDIRSSLNTSTRLSAEGLVSLDLKFGYWSGEQVRVFKNKYVIRPQFIASHGHTVFHQPENGITLQIGDINAIHAITDLPTVGDFRKLDVMKGGQGAPLVPIGDELLFSDYSVCLNLGGIANLSFKDGSGKRLAYDICPCNLLLNRLAQNDDLNYDEDGKIAASGTVSSTVLENLNNLPYYKQQPPKSLGLEQIMREVYPVLEDADESTSDLLATASEHIAIKISEAIRSEIDTGKVLISGGGAYNRFLIKRLKDKLGSKIEVPEIPEELIDYKESLIFAFLGVLNIRGEINVLSSVTGADSDSVSGIRIGKFPI